MREVSHDDLLFNPNLLTILIVDDQATIRAAIRRISHALNFGEILECSDGEHAIKILTKKPVDIMVLDLSMQRVDGFQVLEYLHNREFGCEIPIIIVTGESNKQEIIKATNLGVWGYLLKPFQANDLERKIVQTLNNFYSPPQTLRLIRKAERSYFIGDFGTACAQFQQARSLDPSSIRAAHGLALALDKIGSTDEAIRLLLECIQNNTQYHKAYHSLANIYLRQNNTSEAIELIKQELTINSKQPERQLFLAEHLNKSADYKSALFHYRESLKENPKCLDSLLGTAIVLTNMGNIEKAFNYLRRSRRFHPRNRRVLETALRCGIIGKSLKTVEYFLKDEQTLDPNYLDLSLVLARVFYQQNRHAEAISAAEKVLQNQPTDFHAVRIRALAMLHQNLADAAITEIKHAISSNNSRDFMLILGEIYLYLNQSTEALRIFEQSMQSIINHPYYYPILANVFQSNKQWLKAYLTCRIDAGFEDELQEIELQKLDCLKKIQMRRDSKLAS